MSSDAFELVAPVVFVIFNRPQCTAEVFAQIRKAQPKELYIVADGPRSDHPEDIKLCGECRAIVENVDWPCNVHKNYSDTNLGCGKRPATGFSWVFDQVEEAIILEDDCVPSMSFFRFCQEMLKKYRRDDRVDSISGMNLGLHSDNDADYFFTSITRNWGWATWRRVWQQYDYCLSDFPDVQSSGRLVDIFLEPRFAEYWYKVCDDIASGKMTSAWDTQFAYMSFKHHGLHVYPQKNLVSYIGFNEMATHTNTLEKTHRLYYSTRYAEDIDFPLRHPSCIQADFRADYLLMTEVFNVSPSGVTFHFRRFSKNELQQMQGASTLLIYGAGAVCREAIPFLNEKGINRFSIVVTKLSSQEQYIMGNKVHELSEYIDKRTQAMVLLAVTQKYQGEMIKNLESMGFRQRICLL